MYYNFSVITTVDLGKAGTLTELPTMAMPLYQGVPANRATNIPLIDRDYYQAQWQTYQTHLAGLKVYPCCQQLTAQLQNGKDYIIGVDFDIEIINTLVAIYDKGIRVSEKLRSNEIIAVPVDTPWLTLEQFTDLMFNAVLSAETAYNILSKAGYGIILKPV